MTSTTALSPRTKAIGWLLPAYLLAVLIAWALKAHYSQADSEQLNWMLAPTARLVQTVSGIPFAYEAHSGYVNWEKGVVIAPACAGVNFMIIAYCLAAFTFLHRFKRPHGALVWVTACLVPTYGLTLVVNTLRITTAIFLYDADIYHGWMTPRQVHRLAGILTYLGAVFAWHAFLDRWFVYRRFRMPRRLRDLTCRNAVPVCWYVLIVLAVPLVNSAFEHNLPQFVEHVGIVSVVCLVAWAGISLLQLCYGRIRAKMGHT